LGVKACLHGFLLTPPAASSYGGNFRRVLNGH
jgi:hypothetical protein